jgi:hypothetical protein
VAEGHTAYFAQAAVSLAGVASKRLLKC